MPAPSARQPGRMGTTSPHVRAVLRRGTGAALTSCEHPSPCAGHRVDVVLPLSEHAAFFLADCYPPRPLGRITPAAHADSIAEMVGELDKASGIPATTSSTTSRSTTADGGGRCAVGVAGSSIWPGAGSTRPKHLDAARRAMNALDSLDRSTFYEVYCRMVRY
jgi:hypothetical protein